MARLLVVTNDFPPGRGGIETYVHELVRRFDLGDVVVLTSRRDGWEQRDTRRPGPARSPPCAAWATGWPSPSPDVRRGEHDV